VVGISDLTHNYRSGFDKGITQLTVGSFELLSSQKERIMDISLEGKTAIVAGSTQGIGKAAALGMAKLGGRVILLARNRHKLESVLTELDEINRAGHDMIIADFSDPNNLQSAVKEWLSREASVHILVNNTGGPKGGPAIDAELQAFRSAFEMHLICNQILVQLVVPEMKKARYGRIVNVISTSVKQPLPNLGVSNTIRGAVANWSKTLANELGEFGITVNNVLPGATDTARLAAIARTKAEKTGKSEEEIMQQMAEASPMKRVAKPEEVAHAICFLASPAASYINGINLPVDGGRTGCL
jgi:3-oxoacyl-[acyl-carrier protein] reductase